MKINNIIDSELPLDILPEIFSKSPWFNLLNFRLVCKAWNTLILSFMTKSNLNLMIAQISPNHHLHLHCVELNPKHLKGMNIVGSLNLHPKWDSTGIANTCNGLLSIFNTQRTEQAAILNPMTYEYMNLPIGDWDPQRTYLYGLGFSPKTRQYKIARHSFKNDEALVEILGFVTKMQWRCIARIDTTKNDYIHRHGYNLNAAHGTFFNGAHGTYFNGAIYWVGIEEVFGASTSRNVMWRVNVEDEKFEKVLLPKIGVMERNTAYCGVFNGRLYISHYATLLEYHVWMMDEEGLWERAFFIRLPHFYKSWANLPSYHFQLLFCDDGKILCLLQAYLFVSYDPKNGQLEFQVEEETMPAVRIYHIDSIHFHSLPKLLAGDVS